MWLVLLQYYSVLPSTTPVRLRTTKLFCRTTTVSLRTKTYYSSTTVYKKVVLQSHSVLQSATPVLLCTDSNSIRRAWCGYLPRRGVFTVDLGCPSFEYLVTSFTTSFIPRSRPRSLPLQKACFQAAISKQFALNMIVWLKD